MHTEANVSVVYINELNHEFVTFKTKNSISLNTLPCVETYNYKLTSFVKNV